MTQTAHGSETRQDRTEFPGSPPTAAPASGTYLRGVALILLGGTCLSFGGLLLRNVESADGWLVLFYRSLAFAATVLVFVTLRYRGRILGPFRAIGGNGAAIAVVLGLGFTAYLFAILLAPVANVQIIMSSAPFFAALLAWIVLGERVSRLTWMAILATMAGLSIMVADGLAGGHLLGALVALGIPLSFAVMIVLLRRVQQRDMVPATFFAGLVAAAIAFFMVDDFAISRHDLTVALLLGTVQVGLGFIFITIGTRWVLSAEVALLSLIETILAPIWVWIFVDETPTGLALLGGAVVLAAIVGQGVVGLRQQRAAGGPAQSR